MIERSPNFQGVVIKPFGLIKFPLLSTQRSETGEYLCHSTLVLDLLKGETGLFIPHGCFGIPALFSQDFSNGKLSQTLFLFILILFCQIQDLPISFIGCRPIPFQFQYLSEFQENINPLFICDEGQQTLIIADCVAVGVIGLGLFTRSQKIIALLFYVFTMFKMMG